MTAANKTSVPMMKQEIDALKKQYNNKECYFCGAPYTKNHNCPARGKTCSKCNKLNHFAKVCKSKGVNEISQQEAGTSASEFMIDTVNSMPVKHTDRPDAVIRIVDQKLDLVFKINTGAEANVLPVSDYNSMVPKPRLQPTKDILTSYSGERLQVLGFVELCICYKEGEKQVNQFHVVNTDRKPILSRKTSQNMKLIKFILNVQNEPATSMKPETARILEEYEDVFEGVGKLPGKCKIHLKEGAVPTVQPPKRVPIALQEKLKEELDRLEVMGIIEKTTTPTEWVNSIVVVQKPNGSLRICLDPVDLNKWVQRPYHLIPSFDDVAAKCSGSNTFFKLDARQGCWSMELDEESSLLTTFSTTFGRYRWKRYPFGVKSAQDEFQRKMEEVFEGLDIGLIIDDIAGTAANTEDHDAKLRLVLQRAREKGVRFNRDKCIFNALNIPYFGHLLTTEGIKADPEKTKAIANMPAPESHEQLQVLLGMYNYLARYIPNLSTLNHPLRELSKSKTYDWTTQHENARKQIQASICKNLSYFDHKSRNVKVINRLFAETQLPDRLTKPENSSDEIHSTEPIQEEPIKETEEEVRTEISPAESISQESQEEKLEKETKDKEVNDHITEEKANEDTVAESKKEAVDEGEPSTSKKNNDSQSDKIDDSPSGSEEQVKVESVPSETKVRFTVSTPEHDQENETESSAISFSVPQQETFVNPAVNSEAGVRRNRKQRFDPKIVGVYIDKQSRIYFPAAFLIFNAAYWCVMML
ncbi:hypothetical protein QYM36_009211 [Artemia franciscana]|uniref:Reverse transcriptase domain-containing protein n=1 Tax=Artemia franciscana TaxID=6661 RepID=A0AA88L584_ARTSF|nr:hypothetical protein QYM36_009211 [Artemia franciscana]